MITIHHLGISQSDRVVWLMEELGLPYTFKWYSRGPDRLAPPEYLALHPAATSPVIEDDGRVIAESVAIVEYIAHRYGKGRFTVAPSADHYPDYLYWMMFNNNVQALFFGKLGLSEYTTSTPTGDLMKKLIHRREESYYHFLDQRLGQVPYLAGQEFTLADLMVMFNVAELPLFGGRSCEDLPNVKAWAARIEQRPAYQKAMKLAGPAAKAPA